MMRYFRNNKENGSSDIVTTLIMLPFAFFLILSLIEVSLYFSTRSLVQNTVQDATRQAASWGGNDTRLKTYSGTVAATAAQSLNASSSSARIRNLTVQCTPGAAAVPGENVECTASYNYSGVTGGAANFIGFTFLDSTITVNGVSRSSVGFR